MQYAYNGAWLSRIHPLQRVEEFRKAAGRKFQVRGFLHGLRAFAGRPDFAGDCRRRIRFGSSMVKAAAICLGVNPRRVSKPGRRGASPSSRAVIATVADVFTGMVVLKFRINKGCRPSRSHVLNRQYE